MDRDVQEAIDAYHGRTTGIHSDTLGSYKGETLKGFPPVQDADDL